MANTEEKIQIKEIEVEEDLAYRNMRGFWKYVVLILSLALSLFAMYTAAFGTIPAQIQRALHIALAFPLVFILYPARKGEMKLTAPTIVDMILVFAGSGAFFYHVFNYMPLLLRTGMPLEMDIWMGWLAVFTLFEVMRRTVGWPMLLVVLGFMAYALWGHWIPGFMGHPFIYPEALVEHLYLGLEGIMGIPISVCATFLFMYILFGCFMEKSGLGKFFVDLALSLAGHKPGGPAKVAVVGAGLFGMISGSSVANAVTTGNFVIPLMRKVGYTAEFSAGTVAAASTGGQIMPPIMGAAAFIMAEMTGISYVTIAIAAFLPSLLYYLGIFVIIHLESMKKGMQGISRDLLPDVWDTFKKRGYLLIPIVAIIMLLLSGYTPTRAALVAIGLTVVSSYFSKENRLMPKDYVEALTKGARGVLPVVAACAGAGVIVGCVTLTGVGLKVANAIVMLSGGNIFLVMALTMMASLFLGMGLPTTPKYIILSIMAVPAMVQQNVPVLAAHMFILYFGIMADVTPPVAMAAYASAGIARANPVQSGVIAFKLGIAGFIVPYLFVLNPELVLVGTNGFNTALMFVSTMLGVIGLGMVLTGYYRRILSFFERAVILAASLLLIVPGLVTDISGSVILLGIMLWIKRSSQKEHAAA